MLARHVHLALADECSEVLEIISAARVGALPSSLEGCVEAFLTVPITLFRELCRACLAHEACRSCWSSACKLC